MYGALYAVNTYIINYIIDNDIMYHIGIVFEINKLYVLYVMAIFSIIVMIFFRKHVELYFNKLSFKKYSKLKLENDTSIKIFMRYVNTYKEMFQNPSSYIVTYDSESYPEQNSIVNFNDTNLNITGYYYVTMEDIKKGVFVQGGAVIPNVQKLPVFNIFINYHKSINTMNYIETLEKYVSSPLELYSVKTYKFIGDTGNKSIANITYKMYSGNKLTKEDIQTKYIDSFFHPLKDKLWKQIQYVNTKNITNIPVQMGYILHGPPGTGKSRFAYCMALATQRHLISIDILSIDLMSLYQIFKNPIVNNKETTPDQVIYVFDEFDITIYALHEQELGRKKEKILNERQFDAYESKMSQFFINEEDQDKTDNLKDVSVFSPVKKCKDNRDVTVNSLLELIQGPVPLKGAIFIATTNNYEKINRICPALFRTGRLTPVYFGHAENDTLQEISMHYYNEKLNIPNNVIATISTSDIINFITFHKLEDDYQFNKFQEYIQSNITTK
jgi:hypothetical protein